MTKVYDGAVVHFNPEAPMAIKNKDPDFAYKFERSWTINGHEVAFGRLKYLKRKNEGWSAAYLFCECDFDFEIVEKDGRKSRLQERDPRKCPAREKVRRRVVRETRAKYGRGWKKMGLKAAILDVHRRVKKSQWLGQGDSTTIYYQEVAEILGLGEKKVRDACDELYGEEKLDLNGAILTDFKKCFRLPKEMAAVIFRTVGDPLGYPNGDAGDSAVWHFEARVQKELGVKSGRKAFGEDNWPHIDAEILAAGVLEPLAGMLAAAAVLPKARERLRRFGRRDFIKGLAWLAKTHPEIRLDVMAEYRRELVRLAFDRSLLHLAMSWSADKKDIDAAKDELAAARADDTLTRADQGTPKEILAYAAKLSDSSEKLKAVLDRILGTEAETLKEMSAELLGWAETFRKMKEQEPR